MSDNPAGNPAENPAQHPSQIHAASEMGTADTPLLPSAPEAPNELEAPAAPAPTADELLVAWFMANIQNSRYSRDTSLYNQISASYSRLRALLA